MIGLLGAAVMQALQFLLQVRRRERQSGVQLQRRRVHLRRQRPAAALELAGHEAVEVDDVGEKRQHQHAGAEQEDAFQMKSSGAGARRL